MNTERVINCFENGTGNFVRKYSVSINLDTIKNAIMLQNDDPLMFLFYPIKKSHTELLKLFANIEFDWDKYQYEIGCYSPNDVARVISWFDRKTELYVGDYNIEHVDLGILKKIIKPSKNDPLMLFFYLLNKKQVEMLKQVVNIEFDCDKYDYEVGFYSKSASNLVNIPLYPQPQ